MRTLSFVAAALHDDLALDRCVAADPFGQCQGLCRHVQEPLPSGAGDPNGVNGSEFVLAWRAGYQPAMHGNSIVALAETRGC